MSGSLCNCRSVRLGVESRVGHMTLLYNLWGLTAAVMFVVRCPPLQQAGSIIRLACSQLSQHHGYSFSDSYKFRKYLSWTLRHLPILHLKADFTLTFGWKTWRKRPLGRSRRRWEDHIRMDLREIEWECVDLIRVVQDRDQWRAVVNTVMNHRVTLKARNSLTSWVAVSLSRRIPLHCLCFC